MHPASSIHVDPDPAIEGGLVTITVSGNGPWYVVRNPTGEPVPITPDANGEAEITVPGVGGETFTVMNTSEPYQSDFFSIVSPNP